MDWLVDILIIAVLVGFIYRGQRQGVIRGLATLIGIIVGIVFTINHADWLVVQLEGLFNLPTSMVYVISAALIFAASVAAIVFLGRFFSKLIKVAPLKYPDKVIGGLIGFVKGAFILSLVILLFVLMPNQSFNDAVDNSRLAPVVIDVVPAAFDLTKMFHPNSGDFVEEVIKGVLGKKAADYSQNLEKALNSQDEILGVSIKDDRALSSLGKYFGKSTALAKGSSE